MSFVVLDQIRKVFGGTTILHGFSLTVAAGEFVSLLGPSGCGKTTTLRTVAGFEMPTSGRIHIAGRDVTDIPPNRRAVGMVFQAYALFPNMTVGENVGFGLKVARKSAAEIKSRVTEMLELVKLPHLAGRHPQQLSGGQQQRVALARALAVRPKVLLLDEPLSALDAKICVRLREDIRALQRELGITTIYVTHDQEEALSMSDRVCVMNDGRIEQLGVPSEIYNAPRTRFVASFVGSINVLQVVASDPMSATFLVGGQPVRAAKPVANPNRGAVVAIGIRPEAIRVGEGDGDANRLVGTVEDVAFLGPIVRLRLRVGDSALAVDTFNQPHQTLPPRDSQITVHFPRTAVQVIAD